MRTGIWAITAILTVSLAAEQRGVVSGVTVPRTPAHAGVPIEITITGTNPCGAVRIDPGDGTERITHPITQVPTAVRHVYQKAGRFEVRAEGMGNCDGVAATRIEVSPAPAPPPAPPPAAPTPGVRGMDTDRDGVVTRAEWRGSDEAFRKYDANDDGVLSGAEVRDDPNEIGVKAAERWTNTGVYVREGDAVPIASAGTVQLSADTADTSSPGGAGSGRRAPSAPLPDRPAGALIARIGNGPPIFVGAESSLRANATGLLYLGVNDDHLADNRGEFRVKIDLPPRGRYRR
jgi:EF hand